MNVGEPSIAGCGAGDTGMLLWMLLLRVLLLWNCGVGFFIDVSDAWLDDESVEWSLILICIDSSSPFLNIDSVLDSSGIPSVTIGSPLSKFSASRTATQEPTKKINVPITLEAGVAYGVSVEKLVLGAINGNNKKNPFTTNTAEPIVNDTPTR